LDILESIVGIGDDVLVRHGVNDDRIRWVLKPRLLARLWINAATYPSSPRFLVEKCLLFACDSLATDRSQNFKPVLIGVTPSSLAAETRRCSCVLCDTPQEPARCIGTAQLLENFC